MRMGFHPEGEEVKEQTQERERGIEEGAFYIGNITQQPRQLSKLESLKKSDKSFLSFFFFSLQVSITYPC
jgi:hypothetical protein